MTDIFRNAPVSYLDFCRVYVVVVDSNRISYPRYGFFLSCLPKHVTLNIPALPLYFVYYCADHVMSNYYSVNFSVTWHVSCRTTTTRLIVLFFCLYEVHFFKHGPCLFCTF